jgi:hypothetical protein
MVSAQLPKTMALGNMFNFNRKGFLEAIVTYRTSSIQSSRFFTDVTSPPRVVRVKGSDNAINATGYNLKPSD